MKMGMGGSFRRLAQSQQRTEKRRSSSVFRYDRTASRVCHLRNAQPQARQGLEVFYGIIFCTYKSEYGGRSFEGTEVSTREELVGNGDAESPENQGEVIRAGVEDAEIVTWQPVYLPTV